MRMNAQGDEGEWWRKEGYTSEENALLDKAAFTEIFGSEEDFLKSITRYNLDLVRKYRTATTAFRVEPRPL